MNDELVVLVEHVRDVVRQLVVNSKRIDRIGLAVLASLGALLLVLAALDAAIGTRAGLDVEVLEAFRIARRVGNLGGAAHDVFRVTVRGRTEHQRRVPAVVSGHTRALRLRHVVLATDVGALVVGVVVPVEVLATDVGLERRWPAQLLAVLEDVGRG